MPAIARMARSYKGFISHLQLLQACIRLLS
ncbi:hypothetical protein J2T47_000430 [Pseudomonas nitroreducens]|nr:hypothetical protein [Pseudomonas nitroreducens]